MVMYVASSLPVNVIFCIFRKLNFNFWLKKYCEKCNFSHSNRPIVLRYTSISTYHPFVRMNKLRTTNQTADFQLIHEISKRNQIIEWHKRINSRTKIGEKHTYYFMIRVSKCVSVGESVAKNDYRNVSCSKGWQSCWNSWWYFRPTPKEAPPKPLGVGLFVLRVSAKSKPIIKRSAGLAQKKKKEAKKKK